MSKRSAKKYGPFFKIEVNKLQAAALLKVMDAPGAGADILDYREKFQLTVVMDDLRDLVEHGKIVWRKKVKRNAKTARMLKTSKVQARRPR